MADNVAITAGSGTTVATDDVSSAHYQKIKLAVGVADSAVMIGHLEDAAHTTGDGGVMVLAVRQDTAASIAGTDGDYIPLIVDSTGRLWTHDPVAVALLTTMDADTGGILTAVQIMDDWDESDRCKVNPIAGQAGVAAGAGAVGVTVQRVTLASDDPGVALLGTIDADTGGMLTALQIMDDWDETNRCAVNLIASQVGVTGGAGAVAANTPRVTLASDDPAVALLGTIDTDTGNAATSLAVMDDWDNAASDGCSVSGDVAHDAADAGEPVKIGGKARTTNPTAVADADRVDATFDDLGRQVVVHNQVRDLVVQQTTDTTDQTETTIVTAGAAGVLHDLTQLTITNASATATVVTLRDATAGSAVGKYALAANGGIVLTWATPFKQTTAANNWTAQSSATVNLHFVVQAVKNV